MTISRVYGGGWSIGEKLTSSQQNALDINTTYAVDKRAGQTDTVESALSLSGAGRIITSVSVGVDINSTYAADGGSLVVRLTSAITADRQYTLIVAGATTGDRLMFYCESTFVGFEVTIKDETTTTLYIIGQKDSSEGAWVEFIYTGAAWRVYRSAPGRFRSKEFLSTSESWSAPRGVTFGELLMWGGGGGGGAGYRHSSSTTNIYNGSGGGGGGSVAIRVPFLIVAEREYVGNAGFAGAGGSTSGAGGGDGGDSGFLDNFTSLYIAVAPGAQGGQGGTFANTATKAWFAYGGLSVRDGVRPAQRLSLEQASATETPMQMPPASGGFGVTTNNSSMTGVFGGARNPMFWNGGSAGTSGSASGSYRGGGGGGGGGGGPADFGANGGNGTNGDGAGTTLGGGAGSAGTANSGAGGGGGGAPGHGSITQGAHGNGGDGGTGKVVVFYG